MEKKKILVVVDVQNDFISGSLRNEDAIKTVPNIVKKINDFEGNAIYATLDTHGVDYLRTKEGEKLPVEHCIKYTEGWLIEKSVKEALDDAQNRGIEVEYFEKPTFGSSELADKLYFNTMDEEEIEVEVLGFCTSICVISNALAIKTAVYKNGTVTVDASCCACVTPESHKAALLAMKMCQINVINE